jgi:hypothetical protein
VSIRLAIPAVVAADRRLDQARAVIVSAAEKRKAYERRVAREVRVKPDTTYFSVRGVRL